MPIKKGDFIEIEYTGKLKEGMIFDTTNEAEAKKAGIHNKNAKYGPVVICVGQHHLVEGVDEQLAGKEPGDYKFEVPPEKGFGKKNAKLIQLIAANKFKKENIMPMPGMQVNIDGHFGIIKSVSGGRVLVDFNHPLSGQELIYDVKINKIVEDDRIKVEAVLRMQFGKEDTKVEMKEGTASASMGIEIPKEIQEAVEKKIKELVPSLKKLELKK